jgi:hypothetical protein
MGRSYPLTGKTISRPSTYMQQLWLSAGLLEYATVALGETPTAAVK